MNGVRIRVPASTANLGPGFDVLACALDLWLELEVRPGWDRVHISVPSAPGAVGQLLAYGDDVVGEAPAELRDELRRRLEALLGPDGVVA